MTLPATGAAKFLPGRSKSDAEVIAPQVCHAFRGRWQTFALDAHATLRGLACSHKCNHAVRSKLKPDCLITAKQRCWLVKMRTHRAPKSKRGQKALNS